MVSFGEDTVMGAVNGLQEQKLAGQSNVSRVPKYEELFSKAFNLIPAEAAILCILLVRGPQTAGEIRSRTDRLYSFADLEAVFETLSNLEEMALVCKLPRQPGRKENRYTHLLGGKPMETQNENTLQPEPTGITSPQEDDRIGHLQEQIAELHRELEGLRTKYFTFKSYFD